MRNHCKKNGHWLFKLKSNQPDLHDEVLRQWKHRGSKRPAFVDTDLIGGRIEVRSLYLFPRLADYLDWPGLSCGVVIQKHTTIKHSGEEFEHLQLAITSLSPSTNPEHILALYRNHWAIENKLHWVLDVSMGEDACRVKAGSGVMSGLRKLALGILHRIKGKRSIPETMHTIDALNTITTALETQN